MGNEDDKEATVLIGKLVKWYRIGLISVIVFGVLLLIAADDISMLQFFLIFYGVGGIFYLIFYRKLMCPFCRKYVLWIPDRSSGRSGKWPHGYYTPFLPKKCPQCSRDLRVKKKEGVEALKK